MTREVIPCPDNGAVTEHGNVGPVGAQAHSFKIAPVVGFNQAVQAWVDAVPPNASVDREDKEFSCKWEERVIQMYGVS